MSTRLKVILGALVVVIAAGGVGIWWFLRDDAPDPVSLERAAEQVSSTAAGATDGTGAPSDSGIAGTWVIDTESGDFDFDTATGTFAGFRIKEELAGIGSTTAVGRTGTVTGSITIDDTTLTAADFEVDLREITTNDERRNDRVQDALETDSFPTATFALTEPVDLGAAADAGEPVDITATGDLTIHGVTKSVEFPLEAQLTNGTVVVVGSLDVTFSDYGVEVPESQIVLSVEDHGVLELQFLLTKQ